MSERNCGTCRHRAYGDARLISQCGLKVNGDPLRAQIRKDGFVMVAGIPVTKVADPRARNFGEKCRRWSAIKGVLTADGSVFHGHEEKPSP